MRPARQELRVDRVQLVRLDLLEPLMETQELPEKPALPDSQVDQVPLVKLDLLDRMLTHPVTPQTGRNQIL
ncbi:MAG: hypothetical protein ACUZ8A_02665 [Candidatus Bathyanammoxibius sp.]